MAISSLSPARRAMTMQLWPCRRNPADQARNIFRTVEAVLKEAGSALSHLLRVQIFVTDRDFCVPVLEVCGEHLKNIRPASGIYVVSGLLRPEMKVEMEFTARLG